MVRQPKIEDLVAISNLYTCLLIDEEATIHWYGPERFDSVSIVSSLLDHKECGFSKIGI